MRRLTEQEIENSLKKTAGWTRHGEAIERVFRFDDFMAAVAFMNRVFDLSEKMNHHPNLVNVWTEVRISYTTHDAGGLTKKDFEMAAAINRIV